MNKISVVYHSETGRTKKMAIEVSEGANTYQNIECRVMDIKHCEYDFMAESKAIIFGSPTYYGNMSWQMKRFIDQMRDHVSVKGKIGAAFASGSSLHGGNETNLIGMYQAMLIYGMMIYTGGTKNGTPPTHFGAIAIGKFENDDFDFSRKLGQNIAERVVELF